ncbi:hypothetical protein DPMN_162713 [Dreissena polymorpha]|uniref:Nuclease HARBI1 n=1 Tax=Dreissena polymorpha TaxID=45954 RepID=A0A9D4IQT7_DREPO|nr:hypothetical protein DPMN_162713 [Dreissena polymorpha]
MFMACCLLHNPCMRNELPKPPAIDEEEDHDLVVAAPDNNFGGVAARNQFVQIR